MTSNQRKIRTGQYTPFLSMPLTCRLHLNIKSF